MKTFKDALNNLIDEFVTHEKNFSHHDVVTELKKRCNNGVVVLSDKPRQIINGVATHWVEASDESRVIFEERINLYPHYKPEWNGQWRTWKSSGKSSLEKAHKASLSIVLGGGPQPKISENKSFDKEEIISYVKRKHLRGENPSLKQIQSALKRGTEYKSVPSDEIRNILVKEGFVVPVGPAEYTRVSKKR